MTYEDMPWPVRPRLLSVDESRRVLGGIGRTKFYELLKANDLSLVKIGRRSFVADSAISAFIEKLRQVAREPG